MLKELDVYFNSLLLNASSAFLSWRNGHLSGLFIPKMLANRVLRAICCAFVAKNLRKFDHFPFKIKTELALLSQFFGW
jgi:hypothetical protein